MNLLQVRPAGHSRRLIHYELNDISAAMALADHVRRHSRSAAAESRRQRHGYRPNPASQQAPSPKLYYAFPETTAIRLLADAA